MEPPKLPEIFKQESTPIEPEEDRGVSWRIGLARIQVHAPGHPQVADHRPFSTSGSAQDEQEMFAPAIYPLDRCAPQRFPNRRISAGSHQSRTMHLHFEDPTPLQSRLQVPPQDLHFGQFRHKPILMRSGKRANSTQEHTPTRPLLGARASSSASGWDPEGQIWRDELRESDTPPLRQRDEGLPQASWPASSLPAP